MRFVSLTYTDEDRHCVLVADDMGNAPCMKIKDRHTGATMDIEIGQDQVVTLLDAMHKIFTPKSGGICESS